MEVSERRWISFMRENAYLRESFLMYLEQLRDYKMKSLVNIEDSTKLFRTQGAIAELDNITKFVIREVQGLEKGIDAGRTREYGKRAKAG